MACHDCLDKELEVERLRDTLENLSIEIIGLDGVTDCEVYRLTMVIKQALEGEGD